MNFPQEDFLPAADIRDLQQLKGGEKNVSSFQEIWKRGTVPFFEISMTAAAGNPEPAAAQAMVDRKVAAELGQRLPGTENGPNQALVKNLPFPRETEALKARESDKLDHPLLLLLTKKLFPGRIMAMAIVQTPTYPHKVTDEEIEIGIEARGSIEKTRTYQIGHVTFDGDPDHRTRVQLQYPYHAPVQPNTQAQLDRRQIFADGMAAWSALTSGQKEIWNGKAQLEHLYRSRKPGSYRPHSGCNLFMKDYLLTH